MYGFMLYRYIYMVETEIHGEMSCFYGKCSPDVEQALNLIFIFVTFGILLRQRRFVSNQHKWFLLMSLPVLLNQYQRLFQFIELAKSGESICCSIWTVLFCHCFSFGQMGSYMGKNPIQTVQNFSCTVAYKQMRGQKNIDRFCVTFTLLYSIIYTLSK